MLAKLPGALEVCEVICFLSNDLLLEFLYHEAVLFHSLIYFYIGNKVNLPFSNTDPLLICNI